MLDRSEWLGPPAVDPRACGLFSAQAVRERCAAVADWVESGASAHFQWDAGRLNPIARYVAATIRQRHPDLVVPNFGCWRRFCAAGVDRWARVAYRHGLGHVPLERARCATELAMLCAVLAADPGPDWYYDDALSGQRLWGAEGLAVACFELFASGALSLEPTQALRADGEALAQMPAEVLAQALQVDATRPLCGFDERVAMLRRLGEVARATPAVFGQSARLGHLFDYLRQQANRRKLAVAVLFETLLRVLSPVWPPRNQIAGVGLGDCWPHPALAGGLLPFHGLTQWLCYSLLEVLEGAGFVLEGSEVLTGLPDQRNGGLFLDLGLIVPRDAAFFTTHWHPDSTAIIEWRALTVHALDSLADAVRWELGLTEASFPLSRVLEGGSWHAGVRIAAERRAAGGPPLRIAGDACVL